MARVAAPGLVEDGADRLGAVCGDAGGVPAAQRPRCLLAGAGGHHLLRGARHRAGVEHAPELGHPLVAFLPGPAPLLEVPDPLGRGLGAAAAQRPGQHRHALAVRRDQQRPGRRFLPRPPLPGQGRVEPGRISGGLDGDLLQLLLADHHPGRGRHEPLGLLIGPGQHVLHHHPLQRPGIPAQRQVQHRIPRIQVRLPRRPVGQPPDHHRAELRDHGAGVPPLGPGPRHPRGISDPAQPPLRSGLRIHHMLDHLAQQRPAPHHHQLLDLIKRPHRRPYPGQLAHQPGQLARQHRQARITAGRRIPGHIPFHLRLPFRRALAQTPGTYGTEASSSPGQPGTSKTPRPVT